MLTRMEYCSACEAKTPHRKGWCLVCVSSALKGDKEALILLQRHFSPEEAQEAQREAHPEVGDECEHLKPRREVILDPDEEG